MVLIGGRVSHKEWDRRDLSLAMFLRLVLSVKMPITRGYETILKEIDEKIEYLSDEWQRVQSKRLMSKEETFKKIMKPRMDLILKVLQKLKKCRGILVEVHECYGNSPERERAKGEMESRLIDVDKLMEYFSQF